MTGRELISHDPALYDIWTSFYECVFLPNPQKDCSKKNRKPNMTHKARLSFILNVSVTDAGRDFRFLDDDINPREKTQVITYTLINKFLGYVHPFTAVGLQAEAYAYSLGIDGVIEYLAVLPQLNQQTSVKTHEPSPDPRSFFCQYDGITDYSRYSRRCWLHTNPNGKACMSPEDIYRMFKNGCNFAVVISPINQGVKALCVRLTDLGRNTIRSFEGVDVLDELDQQLGPLDEKQIIEKIENSSHKFYTQIPFDLVLGECHVVDYRSKEEISSQICEHLKDKEKFEFWTTRLGKKSINTWLINHFFFPKC